MLLPVPFGVPIFQNPQGMFFGHPGMGRFLALEPDIPALPPPRFLNRARKLCAGIPEAVVPDLVYRELREFPCDLCVGVPFLSQIPPDNNNCTSWFSHVVLFCLFAPRYGPDFN